MNNEQDSTSIARIKPPKQISEPFYIRLEELESVREIRESKKQHLER